ncbi:alkaline phosphatase D family protein [Desertimonas flava]|uniref:alkaline phosphatase D family protein n=1 Tax=Desertimonas flava TaxID=2064846 RepID=UPI0013C4CBB2|nr:alkaline phosphatase D family protein [Desertimonas flava]
MTPISRRDALGLGAAALAAFPLARAADRRRPGSAPSTDDPFVLGVCSGDPDATSVVLWTRLAGPGGALLEAGDVPVTWELSEDEGFTSVVAGGTVDALAREGHAVHAVVDLSAPAWFRFTTGGWTSPIGRTAPAPRDADTLTVAAASCQNFEVGYYAAHRDIAEWQPDLVVFLGDFIYEYAANPVGDHVLRSHHGPEVRTIDDYRIRYGQYLGDRHLAASRAAAPWLAIWDDHEVENNHARLVPEDPADVDGFAERRLAAYQAWWEHMPVRMARPTSADFTIYRRVEWSSLATFFLLDGRQYRSDQACGDVTLNFDPPCADALVDDRTMLGSEQEVWLAGGLADVSARWAVIAQQTVVSDMRLENGAIINYDQWDGYAPARDRLLLAAAQPERTIVLTGDIHLAAAARLPGVGAEFVSTGVSSRSPVDQAAADALTSLFPDVVGVEADHRGYVRHTVTNDAWTAEFRTVDDATDPDSAVSTWKTFTVDANVRDVVVEA